MKYRIKHVEMIGYFAQVKRSFFAGWKTIGRHSNNRFGEYPKNHIEYPIGERHNAVLMCKQHADLSNVKKGLTTYTDIQDAISTPFTKENMELGPGYQFRLSEGMKSIKNSASFIRL